MKKNILLIDDEKMVRISLKKLLSRQDYNVVEACDVKSALQEIRESDFDLIVSDVRIPDVDGIEGIQKIRGLTKELKKPSIPEILITGYADLEKFEKAMSLNVTKYLYKPFDNNEFLSVVKGLLNP